MHFAFNETLSQNIFLPVELQRLMLVGDAKKSSALVALGPSRRQVTRPKSRCFFSWAGAVRGRNNPSRSKLLQLRNISGSEQKIRPTKCFSRGNAFKFPHREIFQIGVESFCASHEKNEAENG
jgi:hypothetical protein